MDKKLKKLFMCFAAIFCLGFLTNQNIVTAQQKQDVTFTVLDETGQPAIGATIVVKGTNKAESVDLDGHATLKNVDPNATVEVILLGMKKQTVALGGRSSINVNMEPDALGINELVVVGFGTQKKVDLTGSVTQLKAEEIENRPVANVTQALQGKVPGLNMSVNSSGGELNNSMNINIRGAGTIGTGSNSSVLVLIDGVEGNLNTINPNDIENFSILKDAASSAIYGSRAPFGVILVTTKKGKQGKTQVNYSANLRWSSPLKLPEMLKSIDFAEYWNYADIQAGQSPSFNNEAIENIKKYLAGELKEETEANAAGTGWKAYGASWANNDWFDIFYKDYSFSQEHNLSVSGGTEKLRYYLSGNWLDQNGLLNFSKDKYQRYNINAKITAELAPWARVNTSTRFVRTDYNRAAYQTGLFYHNIARRWPTLWKIAPEVEGYPFEAGYPNYGEANEIIQLLAGGRDITQTDVLTQQISLELEPIKDWKIFVEANYKTTYVNNHWEVLPVYQQLPDGTTKYVDFDGGGTDYYGGMSRVSESAQKTNYFSPNIYTEYKKAFGDHNFKIMAGYQSELNKYRSVSARGDNLMTTIPTIDNTSANPVISGGYTDWATMGIFGRFNYAYQDKYLFEASLRYDGSSRFRKDNRWDYYPSLSAGWVVSSEKFFEPIKNVLNFFKIKASWGQVGNQYTSSAYPTYSNYSIGKNYGWLIDGSKPEYYVSSYPSLISESLTWETVESWNIGVEFGLFQNRLTGVFEVYNRKTKNMVGPAPTLPAILGTSVPTTNNADLKAYGWELSLSWQDKLKCGLAYGIDFNLSDGKRKVTRYPNPTNSISDWYAGETTGNIWGYTTVGIAQSDAEMNAHLATANQSALGSNWAAGDIMYADINGDGVINGGAGTLGNTGDRKIIGNNTPRYNVGLNLTASYKGFDLSAFFQGTLKRDYWCGDVYFWGASANKWQASGFKQHLDFWRPADETGYFGPNTDAYFPRAARNGSKNQNVQTRYLQDASYIRLKNLQIGYTLPEKITRKFACQKLRVYVSGENLITWTDLIDIFDPETISGSWGLGKVYPLQRTWSVGINVTF